MLTCHHFQESRLYFDCDQNKSFTLMPHFTRGCFLEYCHVKINFPLIQKIGCTFSDVAQVVKVAE
jgi:hypothetical protein